MPNEPYVRSEFKVTAKIGTITFDDVVAVSATFGLNSIPTASLQVASGKCVQNGKDATIHEAIDALEPRQKAIVTLTIKTTDGYKRKMIADGTYVIFDGYYAGIGYQRSSTNATYTIHLLHWIDDLNCSSALNGNWFQGAPHDLAQSAVNYSLGATGSGAMIAPMIEGSKELFTKGKMETDLWGAALKPMLIQLANMRHMSLQEDKPIDIANNNQGAAADGFGGASNKAAQDALDRMPGEAPEPAKLPLALGGVEDNVIWYSVSHGLSNMLRNGIAYSSFWSKLVGEIGAGFLFGISPSIEFANVFPYFGGLSRSWRTIYADEYNYASFNAATANLIESVNIFYSPQINSGKETGGRPETRGVNYYRPWGVYPPTGERNLRGQILARDPPVWIANASPQAINSQMSALAAGDAETPQAGPGTLKAPSPEETENNIYGSGILTRFAEHFYKSAILSQRSGELSGKLRFDIAPGSTVMIEAPDTDLGGAHPMYATVTQVSYVINAEQHAAGTSFSLINVRTRAENRNELLTKNQPPLYSVGWSGGPLTVEY